MRYIRSKLVILVLILSYVFSLFILFSVNYISDLKWGTHIKSNWRSGEIWGSDPSTLLEYKARYISQKDLNYDSFLFGGSKSGTLHPSVLNKYTGHNFYNYWTNSGCFDNYETFLNFVLSNYKDINEVIISLSSHEVEHYESFINNNVTEMQKTPVLFQIAEVKRWKKKYLNCNTFIELFKNRNIENLEPLTLPDGSRYSSLYYKKMLESPYQYIQKNVLSFWPRDNGSFDISLYNLFNSQPVLKACDENIESIKRIKNKLQERNIGLKVIIMPTLITELYKYNTPRYEQYLRELVNVVDVWNFGGINDIDLNPYNFSDGGHCFDFVSDKIISIVYNCDYQNISNMDDFGILLTSDNIDLYLENQREKLEELRREYEFAGTVRLQTMKDDSFLGKNYVWK